jgi:hypothetical protein
VEDQDADGPQANGRNRVRSAATSELAEPDPLGGDARSAAILLPPMHARQVYRLRAPASGREAMAPAKPGAVYLDRETGEEMRPVTRTLPLAPSESALLRSPENLRICRRCEQLIGLDVSDCPYCGLRQSALDGTS